MKLVPRQPTINADDNVGRGMDFALVTLVFLGIGYGVDRWLDTRPLFMIVLVVFAIVGKSIAMWFQYDAKMRALETERVAAQHVSPRHTVEVEPEPAPGLVIESGTRDSGVQA